MLKGNCIEEQWMPHWFNSATEIVHQTSGEARIAGEVTQLGMREIILQQVQIHVEPLQAE